MRHAQSINDTFKQVSANEGAIVLVSGEAGIGKTAFVTDFAGSQRPFARILWGACDPLFTPRPLGPIYDIALRDLPHLLELLNSGANWFAIAAALQKILIESPAPTIVVFEDIHWADEATLDLIKYLGRRVQQAKTLLILTYREDEVGGKHMLHSVLGNLPTQHTIRLRLEPLSQEAVEAIARKMNRSSRGIYEATRGNPFFVTEVLRSEAGIIPAAGDIPVTVREYVLTRAAQLDDPARDCSNSRQSVQGRQSYGCSRRSFSRTLPPSMAVLRAVFYCLWTRRWSSGMSWRAWRLKNRLPLSRSEALHRKALQVLRERSSTEIPLARLVHHATRAADAQKVLEYGPRAAEQASRHGAHREAVRYYQAAIPLPAPDPTGRTGPLVGLASRSNIT